MCIIYFNNNNTGYDEQSYTYLKRLKWWWCIRLKKVTRRRSVSDDNSFVSTTVLVRDNLRCYNKIIIIKLIMRKERSSR